MDIMQTKVLERSPNPLFELGFIKSYLRINTNDDDALLQYFLGVATEWVEKVLNKSLLKQKYQVSHRNNCFCLPHGPILEIVKVRLHKTQLSDTEYTLVPKHDSVIIQVPFHWKSPVLEVTYWAGFGETPDDVPPSLRNAVLAVLKHLYDNDGDTSALDKSSEPWLQVHRTYSLRG